MITILLWLAGSVIYAVPAFYVGGYSFKHYFNKVMASLPPGQTMSGEELSNGHVLAVISGMFWWISIFMVAFSRPLMLAAKSGATKADKDDTELLVYLDLPALQESYDEMAALSKAHGIEVKYATVERKKFW